MKIPKPGAGNDFPPTPAGNKPCLLVDVVDLGMVETEWKGVKKIKPKCRLVFQTPDTYETLDGQTRNHLVGHRYTVSTHENSALLPVITTLLGHAPGPDDYGTDGIETEPLVGRAGALVTITHNEGTDGRIWGNIGNKGMAVLPLPDGMTPPTRDPLYVRVKDRDEEPPF